MKLNLFELRREIFHILVGILFIFIALFLPYGQLFLFGIFILGILLSFASSRYKIPIFSEFLCIFERECNKNFPGKGVIYFFLGSLLALRIFDINIALAAIMILTFSDPVSHFIGSNFGKLKSPLNRRKNIEGTIAGVIVGSIFASFFVNPLVALVGNLAAMVFELAGIQLANNEVDDNLLIPLVAGTTIFLFLRYII